MLSWAWGTMCVCLLSAPTRSAWPRTWPPPSRRVGLGALCERLPVSGQLLLRRGRGERRLPSPPPQRTRGAQRHVRGGWPWQPSGPAQRSGGAQVGRAPDAMLVLFGAGDETLECFAGVFQPEHVSKRAARKLATGMSDNFLSSYLFIFCNSNSSKRWLFRNANLRS